MVLNESYLSILLDWFICWGILVIALLIENHQIGFFNLAAALGVLKMRLSLDYLFISTVFVIKLIDLVELLLGFQRGILKIKWVSRSLFLIRPIFLEFELLLNVFEVFLIEMGKQIIRFLPLIPAQLRRDALHFSLRSLSDL